MNGTKKDSYVIARLLPFMFFSLVILGGGMAIVSAAGTSQPAYPVLTGSNSQVTSPTNFWPANATNAYTAITNAMGTNALTGPQGPQGPAGTNGLNGTNGAPGANGSNGTNGVQGPAGPTGTLTITGDATGSGLATGTTTVTVTNAAHLTNFPSATVMGLGSASTNAATAFDTNGAASAAQTASLQKSNNLSDVANAATARTNLGLGSAATNAASAFDTNGAASAAQTAAIAYSGTNTVAISRLSSTVGTGTQVVLGSVGTGFINPNSVVMGFGDSLMAGYPVVSLGGTPDYQQSYTGPGYCWMQWLSTLPQFHNIPCYSFGIGSTTSSALAAELNGTETKGTEYVNGAVVGSYGGITVTPSTLIPSTASGGTAYFVTATGINDIVGSISLSTYLSNMQSTWGTIHGYASNVKVITTTIQSGSNSGSNYNTTYALTSWNQSILSQVTGTTTAPDAVADVAAVFNDFISQEALGIYYDNLHLTSAGYQIYAHIIANEILFPGSHATPLSPPLIGGNMNATSVTATLNLVANTTGTVNTGLIIDPMNAPSTGLTAGTSWRIKLADFGSDTNGTYAIGVDPYSMFMGVGPSSTIDFYSDVKPYSAHTATHQMQIGSSGVTIYTDLFSSGGLDMGSSSNKLYLFHQGNTQAYIQQTGTGMYFYTPSGYAPLLLGTINGSSGAGTTTGTINPLTGNWSTSGTITGNALTASGGTITFGTQQTPADNAAGVVGQTCVDANYFYVWTGTNTVKRAALSTY